MLVRLHPEVALYLLEDEPEFVGHLRRTTKLDLELRDDPTIGLDEFRLVSQPAGRDVTDKYAVACGGALNHRQGLYDAVMIKDTHLDSGLSVAAAVGRALECGHPAETITVEVRDLDQLDAALSSGAGRALLDNMSLETLRLAVERTAGRIVLEASGGLQPGGLRDVAETGVDFLSLGWLTHSAPAANMALEMEALD